MVEQNTEEFKGNVYDVERDESVEGEDGKEAINNWIAKYKKKDGIYYLLQSNGVENIWILKNDLLYQFTLKYSVRKNKEGKWVRYAYLVKNSIIDRYQFSCINDVFSSKFKNLREIQYE